MVSWSLVTGIGCVAAGLVYLRRLRSPPTWRWWLAPFMHPDVRLASWDAMQRCEEKSLRRHRRRFRLLLVRHGESAANLKPHIVSGREINTPLSQRGEEQAKLLGQRLKREGITPDRVVSSHAIRARRTAEIACKCLGIPISDIEEEPDVVELSQGGLAGQLRTEVYDPNGAVGKALKREMMFYRPEGLSPDGDPGESQFDVECRYRQYIEGLQDGAASFRDLTVLIFSHGVAIRDLVRSLMAMDARFAIHSVTENTSITELVYNPDPGDLGGWNLVRLNDAAHISAAAMAPASASH